jgi:DNA-directed RNA polymerase subunit RPC12/RpoP
MSSAGPSAFECPTCGAQYKVVRVEAESVSANQQLVCRKCGGPLHGRDGRFILKYFLVDRPRRRALGARGARSTALGTNLNTTFSSISTAIK